MGATTDIHASEGAVGGSLRAASTENVRLCDGPRAGPSYLGTGSVDALIRTVRFSAGRRIQEVKVMSK